MPLKEGVVRMYVCGPTVYDLSHIGHARSAVAFDVIYRYLRYKGYGVTYVRNYTDIDDKIINRANQEGTSTEEIAERYIKAFDEDMKALGVELPTHRPKATETIPEMITLIQTLIDKGYAYVMDGDVYYSVRSFPSYGHLSGKDIEELEAGARVEVDERKKDPLDFALWKGSKPGEPWWESPWGKGRPGWHIECSAMSQRFLGETLDIHGGGKDLIFPHHENEIAQSEATTGKPFVRYWLHNGFVNIEKEKMSKSLGNILTIRDTLKNYSAEAVRLFLLSSHYRSPIDYSQDALRDATAELDRFYTTLDRMEDYRGQIEKDFETDIGKQAYEKVSSLLANFESAMDDDFNTALSIGNVFEIVRVLNKLMDSPPFSKGGFSGQILSDAKKSFKDMGSVLGVFNRTPKEYFLEKRCRVHIPPEDEIERLVAERDKARREKDFKRADTFRGELEKKGIILEDTPKGTIWRVKAS